MELSYNLKIKWHKQNNVYEYKNFEYSKDQKDQTVDQPNQQSLHKKKRINGERNDRDVPD